MELFPTMITPYRPDGKVDLDTALQYVDWYFQNGMDGIFAICQSSEIFYLSLEERTALNRLVYRRAKELEKQSGRPFTVVSSGHVSESVEEQAAELNAVLDTGTDALILITNRLDPNQKGDDIWIENARALLSMLPENARLGLYECPYPYKRLVTPKIFDWVLSTGRFDYMKDTCCDAALIARRCQMKQGSTLKLLNANCQTLLESVQHGADGYCGIMCNFHPRLYALLRHAFRTAPEQAAALQSFLCSFGFIESGLSYPLTAKYHMNLCGIPTELTARIPGIAPLSEYGKSCVRQMKQAADLLEQHFMESA